jgi:hypothetical protein
VLYYDMRNDTADPATLLVDVWLTTSKDGVAWTERHVAGPFDFNRAPIAEGGLFVGDYQGLASTVAEFVPLFAQTNNDANNPTDVFASVFRSIGTGALPAAKAYRAPTATPLPVTPEWQARIEASVRKTLSQRLVGQPPGYVRGLPSIPSFER